MSKIIEFKTYTQEIKSCFDCPFIAFDYEKHNAIICKESNEIIYPISQFDFVSKSLLSIPSNCELKDNINKSK